MSKSQARHTQQEDADYRPAPLRKMKILRRTIWAYFVCAVIFGALTLLVGARHFAPHTQTVVEKNLQGIGFVAIACCFSATAFAVGGGIARFLRK